MQEFGSAWDWLPKSLVDWAQILSAIGTCGAVIVSLWLATRTPAPLLKASAGTRMVTPPIRLNPDARREHVLIVVENVGITPAVVEALRWRVRKPWSLAFENGEYSEAIPNSAMTWGGVRAPTLLQQGERIHIEAPLRGEQGWGSKLPHSTLFVDRLKSRADCNRLRLVIATSVGKPLRVRPSSQLLDGIWQSLNPK